MWRLLVFDLNDPGMCGKSHQIHCCLFTRNESEREVVCIVGLVLNGIRVLDLAKERDDRVQIEGDVSLVLGERAPPHKG